MILEHLLLPRLMLGSFREITPALLHSLGVRGLICDIDNTLVTYDDALPTEEVLRWCGSLRENGIAIAFVSNNDRQRVEKFNSVLGYPAYAKARKPFPTGIRRAMADMGTECGTTALLGDQLLTDAAAANLAGVYPILVPPIRDKTTWFFRFKRRLERPYLRRYHALHRE